MGLYNNNNKKSPISNLYSIQVFMPLYKSVGYKCTVEHTLFLPSESSFFFFSVLFLLSSPSCGRPAGLNQTLLWELCLTFILL